MTTTTRRRRPASDVANSKASALENGQRRFRTKACPTCHHLVKLVRANGSTVCEDCLVQAVINGADWTTLGTLSPEQRKAWHKEADAARKAAERGPEQYRVLPQGHERTTVVRAREKREAEADATWQAYLDGQRRLAEQDVDRVRDLMLKDPAAVNEALYRSHPWHRPQLPADEVERVQRVFEYAEDKLVPKEWLGFPVVTTIEIRRSWPTKGALARPDLIETETKPDGAFEQAELVARGEEPGLKELAGAWLAARGHRWSPEWVSSRELRELLALVPYQEKSVIAERDPDTGRITEWANQRDRLWSAVEPLVAERITRALQERKEPDGTAEDDKAHEAELRRFQRYLRQLRDQADAMKPGLERASLELDIAEAQRHRPQEPQGYRRRWNEKHPCRAVRKAREQAQLRGTHGGLRAG